VCVGVDLAKQNSITQQILAQYLQKRLNRAGGTVQAGGQQLQLLQAAGSDNGSNDLKNATENLEDDDDVIGAAQYYQGQTVPVAYL